MVPASGNETADCVKRLRLQRLNGVADIPYGCADPSSQQRREGHRSHVLKFREATRRGRSPSFRRRGHVIGRATPLVALADGGTTIVLDCDYQQFWIPRSSFGRRA